MPHSHDMSAMNSTELVVVERHRLTLELRNRGRLVPWLGPALRGITALRHRAAECRQPRETWLTTWQYCRGCPHIYECDYGQAFEPDAVADVDGRDAARPLVLAPAFPLPTQATVGQHFHVDLTAIGAAAMAAIPGVVQAVTNAGRFDGLGPDRVRYNVIHSNELPQRTVIRAADLPKHAAASPVVRNVTIQLTGPLFIRERGRGTGSRQVTSPALRHLMQASMRVARDFLGASALCPDGGHRDLDALAEAIQPTALNVPPFSQEKASHRSRQRFGLQGVTGWWRFATLPACLVPWLQLGGLFHVGGHRIAGAGGWELIFDPVDQSKA
jgi:hypothetical protein